ncbi:MAG: hypothetical protein ACREQ5_29925 [Candidatus Dormibacteria bacterium]
MKDRLRHLIERLSEEQAAEVLPLVEARVVARTDDVWTAGQRALDRLHELTANLTSFDAVEAASGARLELDQRPSR